MINFGSIFGKSPFNPMQQHMIKALEAIAPLKAFFEALYLEDYSRVREICEQVFEAEDAADQIKNEIRNSLPRSLFMSIDRRDLLEILNLQDDIADTSQDIVSLLELRRMSLPKEMQSDIIDLISTVEETCIMAQNVLQQVDYIFQFEHSDQEIEKIMFMIEEISTHETKTDEIGIRLNKQLFSLQKGMDPTDVMFWFKIFNWITGIADFAEQIANRLRLMITQP